MSAYPIYQVDYYKNFREMLFGIAQKYAQKSAITWYPRTGCAQTKSYRDLEMDALLFAEALCAHGLQGKHIAIAAENSYEWVCAFLGIVACGSVAICIDAKQTAESMLGMAKCADAEMVLVSQRVAPLLCPLLLEADIQTVVMGAYRGVQSLEEFCSAGRESAQGKDTAAHCRIDGKQPAAIVFTAGTTGLPKPVVLSQQGLMTNASEYIAMISPAPKVFCSLPFYCPHGLTCGLLGILIGGANLGISGAENQEDMSAFDAQSIIALPHRAVQLYQKLMEGVRQAGRQRQVKRLLKVNAFLHRMGIRRPYRQLVQAKKRITGQLEMIVCGGAHLPRMVAQNLLAFGVLVLECYEAAECSPLIAANRKHSYEFSSGGHVLPSLELRVIDGEICVRGPSVMLGYYGREQETKEVLRDGWFHTGDMGHRNRRKFLYIAGRKKNLITLKNRRKISAEEIEMYLAELPLVKEAVAYGDMGEGPAGGAKLAVLIYPDEAQCKGMGQREILERLQREIDWLNLKLPAYKQIQTVHLRGSAFEKTLSYKIKR